MIKGYVYQIVFPGGFTYVGSTVRNPDHRIGNHFTALESNHNAVEALRPYYEKYGIAKVDGKQTFNAENIIVAEFKCKDVTYLRTLGQQQINDIPSDKLINIRAADDWRLKEHDFTNTPVSCEAWANLLFPQGEKQNTDIITI